MECIAKSKDYQILSMYSYLLIILLMHCRYERNVQVHNCTKKVRTSSRTCTAKQAIEPAPAQKLPTIDLYENNDMHFPSVCNERSPHQVVGQDIVIDDIDVGTNNHNEIQFDEHPAIEEILRIPNVKVISNSAKANLVNVRVFISLQFDWMHSFLLSLNSHALIFFRNLESSCIIGF